MSRKPQRPKAQERRQPLWRRRVVPLAALRPPDIHALSVLPDDERALVFGSHAGFAISRDGGASWRSARSGLPGTDIHGFAASTREPSTFYPYVVGAGLLRSGGAGASWTPLPGAPQSTHSVTVARSSAGDVSFAVTAEGLRRSAGAGASWQRKALPPGRAALIAPAPSRPETIYVVTDRFEVHRSRDGGGTWERVG